MIGVAIPVISGNAAWVAGHNRSSKHRRAQELQREGHEIRILGETEFLKLIAID
jgi:hypothetical protein